MHVYNLHLQFTSDSSKDHHNGFFFKMDTYHLIAVYQRYRDIYLNAKNIDPMSRVTTDVEMIVFFTS